MDPQTLPSSPTRPATSFPEFSFLPGNDVADELARQGGLLVLTAIPCSFSHTFLYLFSRTGGILSHLKSDTQVPSVSTEELVLTRLRCNGLSLLLSSYFWHWQNRESLTQRLRSSVPGISHFELSSYKHFVPLTLWPLSV